MNTTAEIISIGDELLIGQVVNTNASWLAAELIQIGIKTGMIITVADEKNAIFRVIDDARKRKHLVIITGGLGPTKDDITKGVLCDYFNASLKLNEKVLENIRSIFVRRNLELTELNCKQAEVPDNCKVLFNELGTAPGMLFENNDFLLVSLPGVPFEMKNIFEKELKGFLQQKFNLPPVISQTVMTCGIAESFLAEKIKDWENELNANKISLAYLPQPGIIRLRLTASQDLKNGRSLIDHSIESLMKIIPNKIFAIGDIPLEEVLGNLLLSNNKTVSIAESCTGGYISHLLTSVSGSSKYFIGSVVAYDNLVKTSLLKVDSKSLEQQGAVSETVVEQMAKNCREIFNTDYSIAVSGIAGPGGGSDEKPVGTIWIAVADQENVLSRKLQFTNDRSRNIIRASVCALDMLRKRVLS